MRNSKCLCCNAPIQGSGRWCPDCKSVFGKESTANPDPNSTTTGVVTNYKEFAVVHNGTEAQAVPVTTDGEAAVCPVCQQFLADGKGLSVEALTKLLGTAKGARLLETQTNTISQLTQEKTRVQKERSKLIDRNEQLDGALNDAVFMLEEAIKVLDGAQLLPAKSSLNEYEWEGLTPEERKEQWYKDLEALTPRVAKEEV